MFLFVRGKYIVYFLFISYFIIFLEVVEVKLIFFFCYIVKVCVIIGVNDCFDFGVIKDCE